MERNFLKMVNTNGKQTIKIMSDELNDITSGFGKELEKAAENMMKKAKMQIKAKQDAAAAKKDKEDSSDEEEVKEKE